MRNKLTEPLKDEEVKILSQISNLIDSRNILVNNRNNIILQMEKLRGINNVRLLRYLLMLSIDNDKKISIIAGELLKEIIQNLEYDEIKWTDQFFRNSWYLYKLDEKLRNTSLEIVATRIKNNPYCGYILCILSMHENGYMREFALKSLLNIGNNKKAAFYVIRANDWVEQVRSTANEGIIGILSDKSTFEDLLDAIPLFGSIESWKRDDFRKLQLSLRTKLVSLENREIVLRKFQSTKNIKVKRELFKYILINTEKISETILDGLMTKDPIILSLSIKEIQRNIGNIDIQSIYQKLCINKSSLCRKASIEIAHKILDNNEFINNTMNMICDKSSQVRDFARYYLKKNGIDNFSELYKKEIEKNKTNRLFCFKGLSETYDENDYDFLLKYLQDENDSIKRTVLSVLVKIDLDKSKDYLIDYLCSHNIINSRFARKILNRNKSYVNTIYQELTELVRLDGFEEYIYINIILLFEHLSKWTNFIEYLKLLNTESNKFDELVNKCLYEWNWSFNKSFIKPTNEQITTIKANYSNARNRIKSELWLYFDKIVESL